MIMCIWKYVSLDDAFEIKRAVSLDMMVARFMASMMMHINVEKDVRGGLMMMKYVVNHHDRFTNAYAPFFLAFLLTLIAIIVEINVMIILSSMQEILGVVMKFVSLASIANIPRQYYSSLVQHKMLISGGFKLDIVNFRHKNPLKNAPYGIYCLRVIFKCLRATFCGFSYYFMPFMTILLNF